MGATPIVLSDEHVIDNDDVQVKDCDSERLGEESLVKEKTVQKGNKVYIRVTFKSCVCKIGYVLDQTFCYCILKSYAKDRDFQA